MAVQSRILGLCSIRFVCSILTGTPLTPDSYRIVSYAVRRHKPGGATGSVSCHAGALDPALWGSQDWGDSLLAAAAARTSHEGRLQLAAAEAGDSGSVDSSSSPNDEAVVSTRLLEGALDRLGKLLRGLEGLALKVCVGTGSQQPVPRLRCWTWLAIADVTSVMPLLQAASSTMTAVGWAALRPVQSSYGDSWLGSVPWLAAGRRCSAPVPRLTGHRPLPSPPPPPGRCWGPGAAAAVAGSRGGEQGGEQCGPLPGAPGGDGSDGEHGWVGHWGGGSGLPSRCVTDLVLIQISALL
jgi:hypothetical protein